jgi:hypothetical protein
MSSTRLAPLAAATASTRRAAPLIGAGLALGGLAAVARTRMLSWGATPDEVRASYPGDDLIPGASSPSTMATTIAAPPSAVWPWLVQMGCERAGFYSWDRLDNGGRPSAERIHPEWQGLQQGDRIMSVPDGRFWFDVAALEPERALVLRASVGLPKGRWFDPAGRPPRAFTDSTWGFHQRPTDAGGTRLVVRTNGRGRPRGLVTLTNRLFWEPAHWIMQRKQFTELRRRAEAFAAAGAPGSSTQRPRLRP